jgi:hypothetical protein
VVGTLIEKEVIGWKPPQSLIAEVARSIAEEIHEKVDRHGKPVTAIPDDGRRRAPILNEVTGWRKEVVPRKECPFVLTQG